MSSNRIILGILVVLLLAAVGYEVKRTRDIDASFAALGRDRDELNRQVKLLTQLVTDLNELQKTALPTAPAVAPVARAAAPALSIQPTATPTVSVTAPKGWSKNASKPGAYVVGLDREQTYNGMPSAYVKSLEPSIDGFGGMMQTSSAEEYHGKRVRLSGWVKTQDANDGGGHLWLRVDGQNTGVPLQFDNMNGRAPKGTTDWQQYSVVLDVPPESSALAYGFFVQGTGQMWVSGTKLEEVGPEVPSTNIKRPPNRPKTPSNLSFVEEG